MCVSSTGSSLYNHGAYANVMSDMTEVELPIVGGEVDASDPVGSVQTLVLGTVGIGVVLTMFSFARRFSGRVEEEVSEATGLDGEQSAANTVTF